MGFGVKYIGFRIKGGGYTHKSVCTNFQVNPSKIDEDMAILPKVPVIRERINPRIN